MNERATPSGQISVGDAEIAYRIDGSSQAPWLILSNSLATDHRMWAPQMEDLTRHFRVLRYDKRGHGGSSAPTPPYSFEALTGDVANLMDALAIEKADFVGLSIGGMTGLGLAIHHPDRIRRLVCADARADAPEIYQKMWPANIAAAREGGMAAIAGPTTERWFTESYRNDPMRADALALVRDMITATTVDGYEGCASCLTTLDYLPGLGSISCPVLYMGGVHDPAAPIDVMRDMAAATPGADFAEIPDAAHLSNMENPRAFNRALINWLVA